MNAVDASLVVQGLMLCSHIVNRASALDRLDISEISDTLNLNPVCYVNPAAKKTANEVVCYEHDI